MKTRFAALPIAFLLLFSAGGVNAAAGETSGSYMVSELKTLFNIGGNNAGGTMWTSGRAHANHKNSESFQMSRADMNLEVQFLKKKRRILENIALSRNWRYPADSGTTPAKEDLISDIRVMGTTVASPSCKKKGGGNQCETQWPKFSKTFFSASAKYPISILTLTVKGEAVGSASMMNRASSEWTNSSSQMVDTSKSLSKISAGIDGRASVSAGVPVLAKAGVTTFVNILDASIKTDSYNKRREYHKNSSSKKMRYQGKTKSTAEASIGAGKVELWAKVIGIKIKPKVLASWKGKNIASHTLFSDDEDEYFARK